MASRNACRRHVSGGGEVIPSNERTSQPLNELSTRRRSGRQKFEVSRSFQSADRHWARFFSHKWSDDRTSAGVS